MHCEKFVHTDLGIRTAGLVPLDQQLPPLGLGEYGQGRDRLLGIADGRLQQCPVVPQHPPRGRGLE